MELERRARLTGKIGIIGAILWIIDWTCLVATTAAPKTGFWYFGQSVATVALLATAVLTAGLWWIRAGGDGRFARIVLALWPVGWTLIFIGALANLVTGTEDGGGIGFVFPIGGILASLVGLVGGIMIARKGVLTGWRRWAPLALGIGYLLLGAVEGDARTTLSTVAELVQYLLILLTAVALATAKPAHQAAVPAVAAAA